jgi:hypothetical protein
VRWEGTRAILIQKNYNKFRQYQDSPAQMEEGQTHHPRNLTLSPTSFSGNVESRQSWEGRGPYVILMSG